MHCSVRSAPRGNIDTTLASAAAIAEYHRPYLVDAAKKHFLYLAVDCDTIFREVLDALVAEITVDTENVPHSVHPKPHMSLPNGRKTDSYRQTCKKPGHNLVKVCCEDDPRLSHFHQASQHAMAYIQGNLVSWLELRGYSVAAPDKSSLKIKWK